MKIDLSGRTAIVTGSTGGIGLAIARGLALAGASVIVNGRGQSRVDAAVQAVQEAGGPNVRGVSADLASAAGCDALAGAAPDADILVNNVGVFGPREFFEIPDEEWQRFLDINLMSGVRMSRALMPGMMKRGWGRVIFLSSESGLNIPTEMIHYGVTKTAYLGLSRGLAKLAAGTGVTVNAVLPGPTLSEGVAEMLEDDIEGTDKTLQEAGAEFVQAQRPSSIIRRAATVEEVANMVVYACSTQASATTGAALRVDGGVVDSIV